MRRLPDGGKAWFVRVRTATSFQLTPIAWEGWAVTASYGAVVLGIWLGIGTLRPRGVPIVATIGGVTATLVASALLMLVALRRSAPSPSSNKRDITMQKSALRSDFRPQPGYWFVPKLFGIGATPVTWQGWALTLGFVVALSLDLCLMPEPIAKIAVAVALVAAFTVVCVRTTDGRWRWRWGAGK